MTSSANEKVVRAKNNLANPSQAESRKGEAEFVCILCQFNCHDNRTFQDHLKDHKADWPFKCSECEFRGKTKEQLRQHSRIHFAPKKYSCQFCKYKSYNKRNLDIHTRIHTGETPFKCDLCDYSTAQNSRLTVHKNIVHRRILEHICLFCNANFGRRDQLEKHMRKHTTEKPFSCQGCNREYADQSNLRKHQRSNNCYKRNSSSNALSESLTVQHSVPQKYRKERRNPKALVAKPPHFLHNERRNIPINTTERIQFKTVRVPVLLPVEILKKLVPGEEDPYSVPANSNAEVSSPKTAPQSENPNTANQVRVRAVAEDPLDSGRCFGTSTEQDGCQTLQTSGEQTDNEAIPCRRSSVDLRTLPPTVPKDHQVLKAIVQNLDNALNWGLSIRKKGIKGPYACACCSFSCRRQDRLQRHCKRNHFSEDSQNLAPNSQTKLGVRRSETKLDENAFLDLNQYEQMQGLQSDISWSHHSPESSFLSPRGRNGKPSEDAHSTCSTEIVSPISPRILKPKVRIPKETSDRKPLDCDFCDQWFPSAYALLDHLRHHTGQQLFKCKIADCNFKTIRNDLYSLHKQNHGHAYNA